MPWDAAKRFLPSQTKMAEIAPSLPNAHIVRTYPKDYAASDTESEGEVEFEPDMEDEEQVSVAQRLVQNQEFLDRQIAHHLLGYWNRKNGKQPRAPMLF